MILRVRGLLVILWYDVFWVILRVRGLLGDTVGTRSTG